jgi:hypothetical protein
MAETAGHHLFPKSVARMQRAAGKQLVVLTIRGDAKPAAI